VSRVSSIVREDAELVVAALGDAIAPLAGSTLLVTGASGFLCSYFLDVIAAANDRGLSPACRVIGLDNFQSSLPERLEHLRGRRDVSLVQHDMRQPFLPSDRVQWIIHGASVASPTFYRRFPLETIDVNVNGTRHLLDLARAHDARSLLVISTSEIYGDPIRRTSRRAKSIAATFPAPARAPATTNRSGSPKRCAPPTMRSIARRSRRFGPSTSSGRDNGWTTRGSFRT
jgi:dTDP-glucose 4,6-dehydratase/UDP-glucuronate decarboxylase